MIPHCSCCMATHDATGGVDKTTHMHTYVHTHTAQLSPGHLVPVKGTEALKEFSVLNFANNRASYLDSTIVCVYSEEAKWSDEVCHCCPVWVFSDYLA